MDQQMINIKCLIKNGFKNKMKSFIKNNFEYNHF